MEKVWIVGAKGHLGHALCALLDSTRYTLLETDRDTVDVEKLEEVRAYAAAQAPTVFINCTGFNNESGCELDPDRAYRVNAIGARNLALAAQDLGAKMIQLSTDDVFGSESHCPYHEFDTPSPSSEYGASKLAGERFVAQFCTRHVIVRSSWVYGIGNDFVTAVLSAAADENCPWLAVATDRVASPTSVSELARMIELFIARECPGVYHAVCQGSCSRYDLAAEILRLAGAQGKLSLTPIHDVTDSATSDYTVLENRMLRLEGLAQPKAWKAALAEYLQQL